MFEKPHINHNVYILGAGFSFDSGTPLVNNFLTRMADSVEWLYDANRVAEAEAIQKVFEFRQQAAGAAFRCQIDVDNIEELFSLASVVEAEELTRHITTAIAATIDFTRTTAYANDVFANDKTQCTLKLTIPDGFSSGSVTSFKTVHDKEPLYHLYANVISGHYHIDGHYLLEERNVENTIISFNYDTVLEDAFAELEIPFTYGFPSSLADIHTSAKFSMHEAIPNAQHVYKLHGSVNWGIDTSDTSKINIYGDYENLRSDGREVLLVPPTWRKVFGGHLTYIWSKAVTAIRDATRIIVIGFSMPSTDTHFKYLIAAGLQNNISLRKFIFVNPALDESNPANRQELKDNLYRVLRSDLEGKGVIELVPHTTSTYFLTSENREVIRRSVAPSCIEIEYMGEEFKKYHY